MVSLGYPDGEVIRRPEFVSAVERIARVLSVPLSVDIVAGFGKTTEEVVATVEAVLKAGGIGIGEQKFRVLSDSTHLERIAKIAEEFNVPILLHFWDGDYNMEFARFYKTAEKFPRSAAVMVNDRINSVVITAGDTRR